MTEEPRYSGVLVNFVRNARRAPATTSMILVCIGVWIAMQWTTESHEHLDWTRWGATGVDGLRRGEWWTLITSCFVHLDAWHLALNVGAWWTLGVAVESELGSPRYVALCTIAAVAASASEVAAHPGGSVGASGLIFGLFGFAWIARASRPALAQALGKHGATIGFTWLVACWIATRMGWFPFASAAHVGGLAVGVAAGWLTTGRRVRGAALAAALALALVVSVFFRPWSTDWNYRRGWSAHKRGDFELAERSYRAMIATGGDAGWAHAALAHLYYVQGRLGEHRAELEHLGAFDAAYAQSAEQAAEDLDFTREWIPQVTHPLHESLVRAARAEAEWRYDDARPAYREYNRLFPNDYDNKLRLANLALADPLASGLEIEESLRLAAEVESNSSELAADARQVREQLQALVR